MPRCVRQSRQDSIRPVEFGWTNVAKYNDYASRDMTLRPDAGRYECGTLNTIGCYGLRAALEFILSVGVTRIATAVQALGDRIAGGVCAKGYKLLGSRSAATSRSRTAAVSTSSAATTPTAFSWATCARRQTSTIIAPIPHR